MSFQVQVGVDLTEADNKLEDFNNRVLLAANQAVGTINRVSEIGLLTIEALGFGLTTTQRLQAQALRTGVNTIIQLRAALAISNPALAAQTILTGGFALWLLRQQIQNIELGTQELNIQLQASFTLLRTAGAMTF